MTILNSIPDFFPEMSVIGQIFDIGFAVQTLDMGNFRDIGIKVRYIGTEILPVSFLQAGITGLGDTSGWFLSGQFKRFIQTRYYLNLELSSVSRPFLYIVMFIQLDCKMVFGEKQENKAAINPMAGTWGVIY